MTTETKQTQAASENIFDIFVNGCRKGWNLATQNLVPNILMAYVIAYILNILGVMDFLNQWLGPVMNLFGLPGESILVLLTTWLSCSAGVGVAASLYSTGLLNGEHITILAPALVQSVIFCGQFIHAILFCSLLLRLLSFDFSLRIFLAQAGQYLDAPEPGTYSTPHTVQFLAGIAAHRFVGMICNSSTKPMNL